jgi:hypothetical protein
MFDDDYCEWDMLDEDLNDTANVKLKHTTEFASLYEDAILGENTLPINNQPTRFNMYVEAPYFSLSYEPMSSEEFMPMVAALKF